uniref:Protein kinase domain-containing protein n=1 Tax=Panagrolaimus superbus TaxID=310955 RepID=A0A914YQS0_9BILA
MNIDYQYVSDATPELPFKWQPLEVLFPPFSEYKTFTQKGDIWSFGILIWEMFERGSDLYPGLNLQGLRSFLKSGQRLPCPKHCPRELYKTMLWCWEKNPENRPNFNTIKTDIEVIFNYIKIHQPHKLNFPVEVTSVNGYECPRRSRFE